MNIRNNKWLWMDPNDILTMRNTTFTSSVMVLNSDRYHAPADLPPRSQGECYCILRSACWVSPGSVRLYVFQQNFTSSCWPRNGWMKFFNISSSPTWFFLDYYVSGIIKRNTISNPAVPIPRIHRM